MIHHISKSHIPFPLDKSKIPRPLLLPPRQIPIHIRMRFPTYLCHHRIPIWQALIREIPVRIFT